MTKELDEKLIEILDSTTNAIKDGADFIIAELPDVIYQLLLWYGIYNFILFLTGILIMAGFTYGSYKWITVVEPKLGYLNRWYGTTFGVGFGGFVILAIVFIKFINLQWLKIWIAPKIWLIEYSASLVKGN